VPMSSTAAAAPPWTQNHTNADNTLGQTEPRPGCSTAHTAAGPPASTSTLGYLCAFTQTDRHAGVVSARGHAHDNPQASTSSAHAQPLPSAASLPEAQPSTSTQTQSTRLKPSSSKTRPQHMVAEVRLAVALQPPSPQTPAVPSFQTGPSHRTQAPLLLPPQLTRSNLIYVAEAFAPHQPLAQPQAPAQPPHATQIRPAVPLAVLIAAAPERLGPPEAGHRIMLGSQAPGEASLNPNPQHQPQPQASAPSVPPAPNPATALARPRAPILRQALFILAPAPNPNPGADPHPAPVALPPAPLADIPRIEDARPGPSAPREGPGAGGPELQPHVSALMAGVVSSSRSSRPALVAHRDTVPALNQGHTVYIYIYIYIMSLISILSALQMDLFPDVQKDYVAELIQQNNVKDLNV